MNPLLRKLFARFQAPAGDDGADTGGTDVLNIEEDGDPEDRGDVVDPALSTETLQALVAAEGGDGGVGDPPADTGTAAPNDDDDDGTQSGKPSGIPKGRFNEVNEQRKEAERRAEAAERELAAMRAAAQQSAAVTAAPTMVAAPADPAFDEDAKEEAYAEAMMSGDTKAATAIRREINAHVRAEAAAQARLHAQAEHEQRVMASALQAQTELTIKTYPYLETDEGAEALELIIASRNAKMAKGMPAHEALRAAVNAIAPKFAPTAGDPPSKVLPAATVKTDSRPAAAMARGAADSTAQPPAVQAGIGNRAAAARIDIEALTDEQFSALSAEEKKRLRGD